MLKPSDWILLEKYDKNHDVKAVRISPSVGASGVNVLEVGNVKSGVGLEYDFAHWFNFSAMIIRSINRSHT